MALRVIFTGVGEAFDERLDNCSLLVRSDTAMVLLDCGFSAPFAFWRLALSSDLDPMALDAVWISHFHGDHFMGLPALLLRFMEEGRTRPLTVVGPRGVAGMVLRAADLAYAFVGDGVRAGKPYRVDFVEASDGGHMDLLGLGWGFAAPEHSGSALALRLDEPGASNGSLFYSGDGKPTKATRDLARGCGLVVHEAYSLDADTAGHGTVAGAVDFARRAGAAALALVHINRAARHQRRAEIERLAAASEGPPVFIPEPGDAMDAPPANFP